VGGTGSRGAVGDGAIVASAGLEGDVGVGGGVFAGLSTCRGAGGGCRPGAYAIDWAGVASARGTSSRGAVGDGAIVASADLEDAVDVGVGVGAGLFTVRCAACLRGGWRPGAYAIDGTSDLMEGTERGGTVEVRASTTSAGLEGAVAVSQSGLAAVAGGAIGGAGVGGPRTDAVDISGVIIGGDGAVAQSAVAAVALARDAIISNIAAVMGVASGRVVQRFKDVRRTGDFARNGARNGGGGGDERESKDNLHHVSLCVDTRSRSGREQLGVHKSYEVVSPTRSRDTMPGLSPRARTVWGWVGVGGGGLGGGARVQSKSRTYPYPRASFEPFWPYLARARPSHMLHLQYAHPGSQAPKRPKRRLAGGQLLPVVVVGFTGAYAALAGAPGRSAMPKWPLDRATYCGASSSPSGAVCASLGPQPRSAFALCCV
jgi:hypothetical protein